MARPTQAKDPKGKADSGGGAAANALGGFTGIAINATITIVLMAIFVAANYFMVSNLITGMMPAEDAEQGADAHGAHGGGHSMTFPYNLDEFIVNLVSPEEKRYLKVKVSLDIDRHEEEPEIGHPPEGGGGHGHGGGGPDPKEHYTAIMEPFQMPIRDVIITKLSSLSAEELSSVAGKELAKDMIKEEVNTIMPEDRQVHRVNFGEFIIQ